MNEAHSSVPPAPQPQRRHAPRSVPIFQNARAPRAPRGAAAAQVIENTAESGGESSIGIAHGVYPG
ncbi:hypothetical protein BURMUCF2_1738 [Burkholderia multivorans CF2]|nr:hypothetical protein BURMUCF2_1738 [Burkholderia multivorans CF2]